MDSGNAVNINKKIVTVSLVFIASKCGFEKWISPKDRMQGCMDTQDVFSAEGFPQRFCAQRAP